jgi:hypothetical protein
MIWYMQQRVGVHMAACVIVLSRSVCTTLVVHMDCSSALLHLHTAASKVRNHLVLINCAAVIAYFD